MIPEFRHWLHDQFVPFKSNKKVHPLWDPVAGHLVTSAEAALLRRTA